MSCKATGCKYYRTCAVKRECHDSRCADFEWVPNRAKPTKDRPARKARDGEHHGMGFHWKDEFGVWHNGVRG